MDILTVFLLLLLAQMEKPWPRADMILLSSCGIWIPNPGSKKPAKGFGAILFRFSGSNTFPLRNIEKLARNFQGIQVFIRNLSGIFFWIPSSLNRFKKRFGM